MGDRQNFDVFGVNLVDDEVRKLRQQTTPQLAFQANRLQGGVPTWVPPDLVKRCANALDEGGSKPGDLRFVTLRRFDGLGLSILMNDELHEFGRAIAACMAAMVSSAE